MKTNKLSTIHSVKEVRTVSKTGGAKCTKPQRVDLLPWPELEELSELYHAGTIKYGERNWELGYEYSKSFASAIRHLIAFWNRETYDKETKQRHLMSAAFHVLALARFSRVFPQYDNRPPKNRKPRPR